MGEVHKSKIVSLYPRKRLQGGGGAVFLKYLGSGKKPVEQTEPTMEVGVIVIMLRKFGLLLPKHYVTKTSRRVSPCTT
jgi:hypothetical protein